MTKYSELDLLGGKMDKKEIKVIFSDELTERDKKQIIDVIKPLVKCGIIQEANFTDEE